MILPFDMWRPIYIIYIFYLNSSLFNAYTVDLMLILFCLQNFHTIRRQLQKAETGATEKLAETPFYRRKLFLILVGVPLLGAGYYESQDAASKRRIWVTMQGIIRFVRWVCWPKNVLSGAQCKGVAEGILCHRTSVAHSGPLYGRVYI